MRPQQNRRMRGRTTNNNNSSTNNNNNNTNRRGPNPLSRSYESNGPEVKIRGNAQHIAEKYTTLARDAQVSGDRVIAENYLQHAEHYNRIILAAQALMPQPVQRNEEEDADNIEANGSDANGQEETAEIVDLEKAAGGGPQPTINGIPAEVALNEKNIPEKRLTSRPRAKIASGEERPRRPRVSAKIIANTEEAPQPELESSTATAAEPTLEAAAPEAAPAKPVRRRAIKITTIEEQSA